MNIRHLPLIAAALIAAAGLIPDRAHALGTAAGTLISNTATANYSVGPGANLTATSNAATITVQQVADLTVTGQNAPTVVPGQTGAAAIFQVTNTGNAPDTFTVAVNNNVPGNQFNPIAPAANQIGIDLYADGFTPGVNGDTYANTVTLPADAYAAIYVFNNIPTNVQDGYTGATQVTVTSQAASNGTGTVTDPATGTPVNVVSTGASPATAQVTYTVSSATVSITKTSAVVSDPYSGTVNPQPIPGAVIRYTLTVSATGSGTAQNVVVTDAIPANTTYVLGTITLNGATQTDAAGDDAADYNITNPGAVTVSLGTIAGTPPPATPPTQTITFDVTIN